MLEELYILGFHKNYICFTEPVATWSVTSMHIFLQFIEAMGMFLCNKVNHHRWSVFASIFFITLELHCLVVVVSVDHISLHLADFCT